ncbi:hypothetical protein Tco_1549432 [Tanacetum coccineum]
MIWHATGKCTESGKMQHPVDGGAWKKFDMKYPDFAKEPRNVRLGLCANESNFMLTLLIPGPKSPGKDIDVYLRPLIEDLQVLWDKKVVCWVEWAVTSLPYCNEETPSMAVKNKIAYVGPQKILKEATYLEGVSREFNGDTDHRDPPKEYPRDVILAQHARLLTRVPGTAKAKTRLAKFLAIRRPLGNQKPQREDREAQAAYSFTTGIRKVLSVHQRVKLPDGFRSCFKAQSDRNDTNYASLKFRRLYYNTQNVVGYLPETKMLEISPAGLGRCKQSQDQRGRRMTSHNSKSAAFVRLALRDECLMVSFKEILEFKYLTVQVAYWWGGDWGVAVLFRVKWFALEQLVESRKLTFRNGMTQIIGSGEWWKNDQYILATQVNKYHVDVPGEDRDICNDGDPFLRFSRSDLLKTSCNDDDGVEDKFIFVVKKKIKLCSMEGTVVVRDLIGAVPVHTSYRLVAGGFINRGKVKRKPHLGRRESRQKTRGKDPDNKYLKDGGGANKGRPSMIGSIPLYYPSWQKVPAGDKARLMATLGDRMRELEATGEHTTAEINAMVRGGKLRGHIPGVGPVMPGYVRSRLSYTAPVDRSRDVDFMMSLMRSDNRFADAFARYDSGGASGSGGSRARDSEGGEDGDDTGGEDGGDDTS